MTLICGVGVNDAGRLVSDCLIYQTWKRMIERVYSPNMLKRNPTYINTTVCDEWLTFSVFEKWMIEQPWEGMQLDKDLRIYGNREYCPDGCAFIPSRINSLLLDCKSRRGELPLGVFVNKSVIKKPYRACVSNGVGGRIHVGYFTTPAEAHNAWRKAKASVIEETIDWWKNDESVNHTFRQDIQSTLESIIFELVFKRELVV